MFFLAPILIICATLLSLLYGEKCSIGGGLMNFCIFEGKGFPLPFYNQYGIQWQALIADFIFWALSYIIIYFLITLFRRIFSVLNKK